MADDADIASGYIDRQVSDALEKIRRAVNTKPGSKVCKECEERIPEARRKLGFEWCVACAEEIERRRSQFVDY